MEISEGVFQFKVPRPVDPSIPGGGLPYTLVYAVETSNGWTVIDAGENSDMGFSAFQTQLSDAGISVKDVSEIVITHGHPDHVGLASRIKDLTGAPLAMHKLDTPEGNPHSNIYRMSEDSKFVRESMRLCGVPDHEFDRGFLRSRSHATKTHDYPFRFSFPAVDRFLEDGEELCLGSKLWVKWTPGHSPGHVCIYDAARRLLFSGDHLLPTITPHVSLYPGQEGNPLETFIQGHRDLINLDVVAVHPAHEHSFFDLYGRVEEIIKHHRDRMDEMLIQVKTAPKTAWEISSRITWNVAPWEELTPRTRRMALMETLAHLRHMVLAGELAETSSDTAVFYQAI